METRRLRLALAQINATVGDFVGNAQKIRAGIGRAREAKADLVAFPELALCGYPPEDLVLKPAFLEDNRVWINRLAQECRDIVAVVGFVDCNRGVYNAAAVLAGGEMAGVYRKIHLPNYGVFDELRYFQSGEENRVFVVRGVVVGVSVCEDIWYPDGPPMVQVRRGDAELVLNISASPYHAGKGEARARMFSTRAADNPCLVAFCNMVGGQDELVFDGQSMVFDAEGELIGRGRQFAEDFLVGDLEAGPVLGRRLHDPRVRHRRLAVGGPEPPLPVTMISEAAASADPPAAFAVAEAFEPVAEIHHALCLGIRDYVRKNGFRRVLIGLSGGVDSALTAAIAAEALGAEAVVGVLMPSPYTAPESIADAQALAANLGIELRRIEIGPLFERFVELIAPECGGEPNDLTRQNLQARLRGMLLMALSNHYGWLVLTTGNKSEVSVGYATLYGDMAGGFSVIKDVFKTGVYDLARYQNAKAGREVIPRRILERAPSAELKPNQTDQDDLPPYEVLDPILRAFVEEDRSLEEIVALGFEEELVTRVERMVDRSEYKRRQAAPGVKITPRAFGRDRRLPISNWYREPGKSEPQKQGGR